MTLFTESAEYVLQPMPLKFGLVQQLIPVVRRVAALENFAKHAVGIIAAFAQIIRVRSQLFFKFKEPSSSLLVYGLWF